MKLFYFAAVREQIGKAQEDIALPEHVATVRDLLLFLQKRDETYANALAQPELVCFAVDHVHVDYDESIGDAQEIAIFPPMTGG